MVATALLGGCVAFNVGEPEHYRLDRGKEGTILVTRQKKMSFGFLPAMAEEVFRPPESAAPVIWWSYYDGQFQRSIQYCSVNSYIFLSLFETPWSLLVTPWYGDYSCDSHYWTYGNVEMLSQFPEDVRDKVQVKIPKDKTNITLLGQGHTSLLGFHRYATVIIEELDEGEEGSTYEKP